MIRIALLIWLLCIYAGLLGQTTFSKLYWNYPYATFGTGINIDDEYIYLTGTGTSYIDGNLYPNRFFLRTNLHGEMQLIKFLSSDIFNSWHGRYSGGLEFLPDSTLVVSGYYSKYDTLFPPGNTQHIGALYRYNKLGDTINTNLFEGNSYTEFFRLAVYNDNIFIGGFTTDTFYNGLFGYLIHTDSIGSLFWESKLGDGLHDEITGLVDINDEGNLISGGAIDVSGSDLFSLNNGKIYKLDSSGNEYFSKEIGTPGDDSEIEVKVSKNGQSYIVRQYIDTVINEGDYAYVQYIGKTDTNLNFIWRTFLNDTYYKYIYTLRTFEDGSIVAVGATIVDDTYEPHGYIIKLDSNGTVLWERDYTNNPEGNHYLYDFQKMPDGGYVCSGLGADTIDGVIQSMCWLLRLDSMGCLVPGCDGDPVMNFATATTASIKLYPNPMSAQSTLEINIPANFEVMSGQMLACEVVDMHGIIVDKYSNIYINNPGETIRFNVFRRHLPEGAYLLNIRYGESILGTLSLICVGD